MARELWNSVGKETVLTRRTWHHLFPRSIPVCVCSKSKILKKEQHSVDVWVKSIYPCHKTPNKSLPNYYQKHYVHLWTLDQDPLTCSGALNHITLHSLAGGFCSLVTGTLQLPHRASVSPHMPIVLSSACFVKHSREEFWLPKKHFRDSLYLPLCEIRTNNTF